MDIAGVILSATKIAWKTSQFITDARTASDNVVEAHDVVETLSNTLDSVQKLLKRHPNPDPLEKKHHESINRIVAQSGRALASFELVLPPVPVGEGTLKNWGLQFQACLKEGTTQKTVERINQCNQILQLDLSMLSMYWTWKFHDSTVQTHELVKQLVANRQAAIDIVPNTSHEPIDAEAKPADVALDEVFVGEIEAWKQSVSDFVDSVVDTESVRIPPTTIWEPEDGQTIPPPIPPQGNLAVSKSPIDQRSLDSGCYTESPNSILHPEEPLSYPPEVLQHIIQRTQQMVKECWKKGLFQQAAEYQKKIMRHRQKLTPKNPLTLGEISEMEETLAEIYMSMGTLEGREEARRLLHNLGEQELGLPEADQDSARKSRLYHKLSKIYLDLGSTDSISIARRYASRAFNDRLAMSPRPDDLVHESAIVLYQALLKIPSPDEAEGLNDYITQVLTLAPIKLPERTGHGEALEWCQNRGFDADSEGFRFDVCDSRLESSLKGLSPLHVVVREGDLDMLKHMVDCTLNLEIPEEMDFATPLLLACTRQDKYMVSQLLDSGAKVNARDRYGMSGLHRCQARHRGTGVARVLLEHPGGGVAVDGLDGRHKTALHLAAEMGNQSMVELLLEKGASPNTAGPGGCTPLMATVEAVMDSRERKREILQLLMQNGGQAWKKDDRGYTPIRVCNDSQLRAMMQSWGDPSRKASTASNMTASSRGSNQGRRVVPKPSDASMSQASTTGSRFSMLSSSRTGTIASSTTSATTVASKNESRSSRSFWRRGQ